MSNDPPAAHPHLLVSVLHENRIGEPPFAGSRTSRLIMARTLTLPPRPSTLRTEILVALDDVVARGMTTNRRLGATASVTLAAGPSDGSFASRVTMLDQLEAGVVANKSLLASGRCAA